MPTSLVIGANRGIGLELCRQLLGRGHQVIATCRQPSPELSALGVQIETNVDVTDPASITALGSRLRERRVAIDWLLLNAGVLEHEQGLASLDLAVVERQLAVNALGPLRVVQAVLELLAPGGKIGIVTSMMGSIADNSSGGMYGYRMSKAAVNMAGVSLARDLRPRNIAVVLLHPGYVKTDMTRQQGNVLPADSVRGLLERMDALTLETSGTFWHANGKPLPW